MSSLFEDYKTRIAPNLKKEFRLQSTEAVPKLVKVTVNTGIGDAKDNKEEQEKILRDLALITGQKPSLRLAQRSISGFGTRKGQVVGALVTLRGERMYDFLQKLFNVVLPRLRDFRGLSPKALDKSANYTLGLSEHTVFPEVDLAKVGRVRGLEITIVTNTKDREKAIRLFEELGMPFEKEGR